MYFENYMYVSVHRKNTWLLIPNQHPHFSPKVEASPRGRQMAVLVSKATQEHQEAPSPHAHHRLPRLHLLTLTKARQSQDSKPLLQILGLNQAPIYQNKGALRSCFNFCEQKPWNTSGTFSHVPDWSCLLSSYQRRAMLPPWVSHSPCSGFP